MSKAVQGCIDCQTPMVDMEKWGNCPNCEGNNIGMVTFTTSIADKPSPAKRKPDLSFYELTYNGGNSMPSVMYVQASSTTEARKLLCYWCENESRTLLRRNGQTLRFWPRTKPVDTSRWQRALTSEIEARRYIGQIPQEYITRNEKKQIVLISSRITA